MITGEAKFRVYNMCPYDIGVSLVNGIGLNITHAGGFQMLTANDIVYIEANFKAKYFTRKCLVVKDEAGNIIPPEEFGLGDVPNEENVHKDKDEITEMLKASVKKMEAWLKPIEDPAQLHEIYLVAKDLDLPVSKVKVLSAKMKGKDWLDEMN